jgi:hypothetical protein
MRLPMRGYWRGRMKSLALSPYTHRIDSPGFEFTA